MTEPSNVIELGAIPSEFDHEDARINRYELADMYQILNREKTTPPFSIEGIICDRGTILSGLEGAGKSTLAAHLTWTLATQQPEWCGHKVTTDRALTSAVVCVDVDGPADYSELWRTFGGAPASSLWATTIDDRLDWEALIASLARVGADVLVIDNLAGILDYEGEGHVNSPEVAGRVVRGLQAVRRSGITPILVAHTSDKGEDYRAKKTVRQTMGSKRYNQWSRHTITLNEAGDDERWLTVQKSNYVRKGQRTYLKFRPGEPELGSRMIEHDPEAGERVQQRQRERSAKTLDRNAEIANYVVANCQGKGRDVTASAVAEKFNLNPATVKSDLSRNALSKMLVRTGRGDETTWSLKRAA